MSFWSGSVTGLRAPGFAVQRKDASGGPPSYLPTYMPFAPDPAAPPSAPAAPRVHSQPSDV